VEVTASPERQDRFHYTVTKPDITQRKHTLTYYAKHLHFVILHLATISFTPDFVQGIKLI
jgi:hypothetical protein